MKAAGERAWTAWTPPSKPSLEALSTPERGSVLAVEMSHLWDLCDWWVSFPLEKKQEKCCLTRPPPLAHSQSSNSVDRLSVLRHVLSPSICLSCLPLFLKAREADVCTILAFLLFWLKELGRKRETYLERDNKWLKESPCFLLWVFALCPGLVCTRAKPSQFCTVHRKNEHCYRIFSCMARIQCRSVDVHTQVNTNLINPVHFTFFFHPSRAVSCISVTAPFKCRSWEYRVFPNLSRLLSSAISWQHEKSQRFRNSSVAVLV